MAQSRLIGVTGALVSGPPTSALFGGDSRDDFLSLDFQATYGASKGATISIVGTDMAPVVLSLEGIVKGRLFALRVLSGDVVKVLLTQLSGVSTILVDDEFFFHSRNDANKFTAISLVGTADLSYVLAGDVT